MSDRRHLLWAVGEENIPSRRVVDFSYSPALGLSDVDFHQITAKNWASMKSPTRDAVARVEVPLDLTVRQLEAVIAELNTTGEYRTVEVVVRQ